MTTQLYRHYDAKQRLLYVGISVHFLLRLWTHKKSSWFLNIATVTVQHYPTRAEALRAEYYAIVSEKPRHNKILPKTRVAMAHEEPNFSHDVGWMTPERTARTNRFVNRMLVKWFRVREQARYASELTPSPKRQ